MVVTSTSHWCHGLKIPFFILGFYPTALIPKYHPKPDTLLFLNSLLLLKILTMKTSERIQNNNKFYYRISSLLEYHQISETDIFQHTLLLPEQIKKALMQKQSTLWTIFFTTEL